MRQRDGVKGENEPERGISITRSTLERASRPPLPFLHLLPILRVAYSSLHLPSGEGSQVLALTALV